MNIRKLVALAATGLLCTSSLATAQVGNDEARTYKPVMTYHGISPRLDYLAQHPVPLAADAGQRIEPEMEALYEEPPSAMPTGPLPAPFVQTSAPKPFAASQIASFEGPGTGLAGFVLTGAPPDMTLAVGPNHVVAWVNSQYAVFNKTGTVLTGPVNGNALFVGMGNVCETTNRGDPILQYDRLADRWVLSQFAFNVTASNPSAPYLQCFAISTSGDPSGTYVRYAVQFSATSPSGFNDYGKLGIWPDGYYTSYNIFGGSPAGSNTGAGLCVSDRVKMLAGDVTATTLCAPIAFYAGGGGFLPADLDGTTLPSDVTQGGIFVRYSFGGISLRLMKLKPNFAAGTVTLTNGFGGASGTFIDLPVGATTVACNGAGGACVPQPGTTNLLDTLADRLMYRAAFRNRAGVESLLVTQSVDPDGAGARDATMRWYEVRNPLGNPADVVVANRPTIFQNGTYDPDTSSDRWMGSIAMDGAGNIMMGYSRANAGAGAFASVAIAGREAGDAVNTMQAEIIAHTGTGSQTGTLTRWGDYSTIQVDPVDDRTFWYIGEYLSANGTFNWRTRIVAYRFPSATTLSVNDVALTEGNSGSTNAAFTITRSDNAGAVSVQVNTSNGTATAGSDYTAVSGQTVNFSAGGALTATVNVPVLGDITLEANETFNLLLSSPTGATISDGTGLGTINNDDSASIAINDVTLSEGNAGTTNFSFTVTLTGAVQGGFTVPFSTSNGTATAGSDYTSTSGSLTFAGTAGETQAITVVVNGDATVEPNETFNVSLGTPSNAGVSVSDGAGLGTINNDDSASIAINDVTLSEGNSGTTNFSFTVSLTGAVAGGFTVPFSTSNGTATAGSDYTSNSGSLTFAGTASETQSITVVVAGDATVEGNETFSVNLGTPSNAGVSVSDGTGLGTINNDDSASIAINDVTLSEGNTGTTNFSFTVTLTGAVQGGFTVPFSTSNGTATAGSDYTSNSGSLTFAGTASETQTVTVVVTGDATVEGNETFNVSLGTPSNAGVSVSDGTGLGTINNDDSATLSISNITLAEGNSGTSNFNFTVALTGTVQGGVTVGYATANGTATSPSDYTATISTLSFVGSNGENLVAQIPVVGDLVAEFDETFTVTLGTPSVAGVTVSTGTATGTIVNDDFFADVAVTMSNGANVVVEGGNTVYTATITNTSSVIDAASVAIAQSASAGLNGLSWTCVGSGGATCPASGSGVINQTLAMPRGSSLSFQVTASIATGAASPVSTTVTATVQAPHSDPNTANNSATDTDVVAPDALFANGYE